MSITRRSILAAGTGAAGLAAAGGGRSQAAAPPVNKQAPGFYRYKLGTHEITAVTDGVNTMPLAEGFVTNVKKDEVNAALAASFRETDKLSIPFTPIVINTGAKLVAIDTGNGEAAFASSKGAVGQYHANLAASGIDRNAVDTVIISHFHGDHINGLVTADGKPAFGTAEILVPKAEWAFWMDDGEMSRAANPRMEGAFKNVRRVFDALGRKVTPYEWDKELAPGILAVATPGHTPGHTSYVVSSGNSRVYVQSDVTNVPFLFARNPGWHAIFDQDPKMAEETRRRVYDMAAAEKMPVQGFHYPFPALGHLQKEGNGYGMVPASWQPVI